MTRNVDGVQIRGLDISGSYIVGLNPLSLPIVNPQTEQAAVNTDQWKRLFETLTSPYQITGNSIDEKTKSADEAFIEQTLAIRVGNAMFPKLLELEKKGTSFNWDLAAMPSFQEAPQTNVQFNGALFGISGQSRYKAQAMQVLALLSSEEVHMEGSRIARQTTLNNTDIQKAFGKDNGSMGTKNILSVQSLKIAKSPKPTLYDTAAKNVLNNKLRDVQLGKKDINTALREADEEINKKIAEEKLRKK